MELSSTYQSESGPNGSLGQEAVIAVDDQERVLEWNDGSARLFGYTRSEVLGRDLGELIIPRDRLAEHRRRFAGLLNNEFPRLLDAPYETLTMRSDGETIPVWVRITRTATHPPNFVVALRGHANDDSTLSHRQLETIVDHSDDAMATLTVDGRVTTWNPAAEDLYGYPAEEAVGRRLSSLIVPGELMHEPQRWLREVLNGGTIEEETRRLHRDRSEMLVAVRMLPVRDEQGQVIGSVMIAREASGGASPSTQRDLDSDEKLWEGRIETALSDEGFVFAAQPVIDLHSEEVDHYELLLRMPADGRLVRPREFIRHAEQSGQISGVDQWTVQHGLELARYHPVAINISILSLSSDDLFAKIVGQLEQLPVDPARITFEITETAAVEDLESAVSFAKRLTQIGCKVALDDFGTGFGSFTYLKRLPVSELKIDQEFVSRITTSAADRRIVNAIVDVARNFRIKTVAEGVEDGSTLWLLKDLGVDLGQGYYLGMPFVVGSQWSAGSDA